ncbi:MAG TPA: methyltransferase domain-containing protein [Vicinamibacterales bacterium]|jgi:ubiquinone/menaquinone biosynthesis C-methylase UbiE
MFPFRKSGEPHALSVAMTGVRLGDQLLQIGCVDPVLLGALGSKVGLSGRAAVAVASDAMETRARQGAERAGVLIDVERTDLKKLPFSDSAFNLVVVDSTADLLGSLTDESRRVLAEEAARVLAPRGRIIVIETGRPVGLTRLFRRPPPINTAYQASGGSVDTLKGAGFRAVRTLADRGGMVFVEGTR